jgi:UDPglucose--hexose-1-phosphate uridylyltransferase
LDKADVDWRVRVVPNLYPAVDQSGPFSTEKIGLFESGPGVGVHEVVIESPRHVVTMSDLSPEEAALVFCAYRDRMQAFRQLPHIVHAMAFKNAGPAAGASLEHLHSHLTGLPIVPAVVQEQLTGAIQYHDQHHRCVYCDMIGQEEKVGQRVVDRSANFIALCPYASRFSYETWVLPIGHESHFDEIMLDRLSELGELMHRCIARIETLIGTPAYNYVVHSAPFDIRGMDHYHWHIEILPRIAKAGGFEWGTGFHINSVPPEDAASALRNVILSDLLRTGKDNSTGKTS